MNLSNDIDRLLVVHDVDARSRRRIVRLRREARRDVRGDVQPDRLPRP